MLSPFCRKKYTLILPPSLINGFTYMATKRGRPQNQTGENWTSSGENTKTSVGHQNGVTTTTTSTSNGQLNGHATMLNSIGTNQTFYHNSSHCNHNGNHNGNFQPLEFVPLNRTHSNSSSRSELIDYYVETPTSAVEFPSATYTTSNGQEIRLAETPDYNGDFNPDPDNGSLSADIARKSGINLIPCSGELLEMITKSEGEQTFLIITPVVYRDQNHRGICAPDQVPTMSAKRAVVKVSQL